MKVLKVLLYMVVAAIAIIVLPIAIALLVGIVSLSWQLFAVLVLMFLPIILIGVIIGYKI